MYIAAEEQSHTVLPVRNNVPVTVLQSVDYRQQYCTVVQTQSVQSETVVLVLQFVVVCTNL